jgi:hypothetical protein
MKFDGLWLLQMMLYAAFGATCSVIGVNVIDRPMAFFALFGLFMANDILSSVRARS